MKRTSIKSLLGQTVLSVEVSKDSISVETIVGRYSIMNENGDCAIDELTGDILDIIGPPIVEAEETNGVNVGQRWAMHRITTANGYMTAWWYGSSVDVWLTPVKEVE